MSNFRSREEDGVLGREKKKKRTIVTTANANAVDHGFPCEEVAFVDGSETFNAFLFCGLGAPCVELFDQPLGCASRRGHLAAGGRKRLVAGMCSTEGLRLR